MTRTTQSARLGRLESVLSAERLQPYLAGGVPITVAIENYALNLATCEAFYPALHLLEVSLRNRIVEVVRSDLPVRYAGILVSPPVPLTGVAQIGSWLDPEWLRRTWPAKLDPLLNAYARKDIAKAKKKLFGVDAKTDQPRVPPPGSPVPSEGQLVAELDFGFWTGLFQGWYIFRSNRDPRLWGSSAKHPSDLLSRVFPHRLPRPRNPHEVAPTLNELRKFRNRVFHHEPIFATSKRRAPVDVYSQISDVIGWIEPEVARLLDGFCRVQELQSQLGERLVRSRVHSLMWR